MSVPEDFGVDQASLRELVLPSDLRSAKASEDRILAELTRHKYGGDTIFAIKLALEEALTNAIKHGNHSDPRKQIVIRFHIGDERAAIMVRDQGNGFRPNALPDPTANANLERPNGRGIMLMQAYMTKIRFNEAGNEVWMLKENPTRSPAKSKSRSPRR
jgi:serine/threonine-protein kinase RsbW